jgi:hypothetical protein
MESREEIIVKLNILRNTYPNDEEIINLIDNCDLNLQQEYQKIVNRIYEKHSNEIALSNYNLIKTLNGEIPEENPQQQEILNYFKDVMVTKLSISQLKDIFKQLCKLDNITDEQTLEIKNILNNVDVKSTTQFNDTELYTYIQLILFLIYNVKIIQRIKIIYNIEMSIFICNSNSITMINVIISSMFY